MRGINYRDFKNQGSMRGDVLSLDQICARDVPYLQKLGINTLLFSNIDTNKAHLTCMSLFEEAGIYVVLGSNSDGVGIDKGNLQADLAGIDTQEYANIVIDEFQGYPNFLGYAVMEFVAYTPNIKMFIKQLKQYVKQKGYRPINIGAQNWIPGVSNNSCSYLS
jgi:hypothetical protein